MKIKMILSFFLFALLIFSLVEAKSPGTKKIDQAKISSHTYQHIKDRHWHDANSGNKTSHFNRDMTAKKLNDIATRTINRGQQNSSKSYGGRVVHEYTFKDSIGRTTDGKKARTVRVVSDGQGNVITAFPIR